MAAVGDVDTEVETKMRSERSDADAPVGLDVVASSDASKPKSGGAVVTDAASSTMLSTDAPQIIEHQTYSLTFTPYEALWIPSSARFVTLGVNPKGTGALKVYELQPDGIKELYSGEKKEGIKCGTFGASLLEDRHLATGGFNGGLQIWDLEKPAAPVFSVQAHEKLINGIDGCGGLGIGGGAPEIVTGSRDGCVKLWDPRVKDAVLSLEPAEGETSRDCWCVAFGNSYSDEERCIASGYDNGDVKLFDLRASALRWETNLGNGVVSLQFDRKDIEMNKLVCTTLESRFHLFDLRTQHPTEGFAELKERAHKSTVWLARHLPQNRDVFMTCGGNGGLNVYKYINPAKRQEKDEEGRMRGRVGTCELLNSKVVSTQPVVSYDWSPDKDGLAVAATLDQQVRVFIVTKLHKL